MLVSCALDPGLVISVPGNANGSLPKAMAFFCVVTRKTFSFCWGCRVYKVLVSPSTVWGLGVFCTSTASSCSRQFFHGCRSSGSRLWLTSCSRDAMGSVFLKPLRCCVLHGVSARTVIARRCVFHRAPNNAGPHMDCNHFSRFYRRQWRHIPCEGACDSGQI